MNRSSKAFFALFVGALELLLPAGVPVCRSTVVRGVNRAQSLRTSFGATRAVSAAACVHSHRALVSNDMH